MAQAATMTMGPPLSPREIRRSGRRSAPSANSKSPDSDLPRHKDNPPRPPQSAPSRTKRTHDQEDHLDDRKHLASATHSSASNSSSTAPKAKRKSRDKRRSSADIALDTLHEPQDTTTTDLADEEEQGITRCVCGSNGSFFFALIAPLTHPTHSHSSPAGEDETDAGEFMVQCETCKVWQHGLCMGYDSEDQVHDADYYCELCRPELHGELLKCAALSSFLPSLLSHTHPGDWQRKRGIRLPSPLLLLPHAHPALILLPIS